MAPKSIAICIDVSECICDIAKVIKYVNNYLENNPDHKHYLYTFANTTTCHGMVFKKLPEFKQSSEDKQYTHTVFDCIHHHMCRNRMPRIRARQDDNRMEQVDEQLDTQLNTGIEMTSVETSVDKVIIVTNGNTDSAKPGLINGIRKLQCDDLEIIVITQDTYTYRYNIIPKYPLIQLLGKYVKSYKIWNRVHKHVPYTGTLMTLLNVLENNDNTLVFIVKMLKIINSENSTIQWTYDLFTSALYEIGKTVLMLYMIYPKDSDVISKIISTFKQVSDKHHYNLTKYDINELIKQSFHFDNVNVVASVIEDGGFVDAKQQRADFKETTDSLIKYGTCHESNLSISLPYESNNNTIVICDDASMRTHNFNEYPNSADIYGNLHLGLFTCPKMIRIAIREFWKQMGYTDSRGCAPMFFVTNLMTKLYVSGAEFHCSYMKYLRTLAICQASTSVMIAPEKYDAKGCFDRWKEGKLIPIHFNDDKTHSSLYTDSRINCFGLTEPLWWASVMSMLGIFDEQLPHYKTAICYHGIDADQSSFMSSLRRHLKSPNTYIFKKWTKSSSPTSRHSSSSSCCSYDSYC